MLNLFKTIKITNKLMNEHKIIIKILGSCLVFGLASNLVKVIWRL